MTHAPGASLFNAAAPRIFTVDADRDFLQTLANAIVDHLGLDDPARLAGVTVFLPTRRAARTLADRFLDVAATNGAHAILPPRIRTLGDLDGDELIDFDGDPSDDVDLPPAINGAERLLVLASMAAARDKALAGAENWAAAIGAARELARLLDSLYTEEIDVSRLATLAPERFAEHWRKSLAFLEIVTDAWPQYLAAIGRMDPAARRAKLIDLQAARWRRSPPATPIVLAGTTASAPSVARLAAVIASLPSGAVVLPGLDRALANEPAAWDQIDDPHPQAGLYAMVQSLNARVGDVTPLPDTTTPSPRGALLSLALRPAEATDDWRRLTAALSEDKTHLAAAIKGLTLIEAPHEEGEASAVALIFRQVLETSGATAMLVTPDRNLARRVSLSMRRWDVDVDDSGGVPLSSATIGVYLRLVADWLHDETDPVALMAMARSPHAGFDLDPEHRRETLDRLDRRLRRLYLTNGHERLLALAAEDDCPPSLKAAIAAMDEARSIWRARGDGLASAVSAHLRAAERIAATAGADGGARLWSGAEGAAAADALAEIAEAADALAVKRADRYPDLFMQLIAGAALRRHSSAHPRLSILGPLEARLQSADVVILAGLNEGVWPGDPGGDPFLSRAMRVDIGLPSPERRIGLAAHDFAQLAAKPSVYLTRSKRAGGGPSTASRWLIRLKNILQGAGALAAVDASDTYEAWRNAIDANAAAPPAGPPRPTPPLDRRPDTLAVTSVETLMRDPYAIWAKNILRLRPLDDLGGASPSAALGTLLHEIFHTHAAANPTRPAADPIADLWAAFAARAGDYGFAPGDVALWRSSLQHTFEWFATFHADRLVVGAPVVLEGEGETPLEDVSRPFTIKARADRIDRLHDGTIALFDYKSRRLPSKKMDAAFSPQLALSALIASRGGFGPEATGPIAGFAYLRAVARERAKDLSSQTLGEDAAAAVVTAAKRTAALIEVYNDPQTPYLSQPRPQFVDAFGDFDQLARRKEWAVLEEKE